MNLSFIHTIITITSLQHHHHESRLHSHYHYHHLTSTSSSLHLLLSLFNSLSFEKHHFKSKHLMSWTDEWCLYLADLLIYHLYSATTRGPLPGSAGRVANTTHYDRCYYDRSRARDPFDRPALGCSPVATFIVAIFCSTDQAERWRPAGSCPRCRPWLSKGWRSLNSRGNSMKRPGEIIINLLFASHEY